jgi:hypothetical protein
MRWTKNRFATVKRGWCRASSTTIISVEELFVVARPVRRSFDATNCMIETESRVVKVRPFAWEAGAPIA